MPGFLPFTSLVPCVHTHGSRRFPQRWLHFSTAAYAAGSLRHARAAHYLQTLALCVCALPMSLCSLLPVCHTLHMSLRSSTHAHPRPRLPLACRSMRSSCLSPAPLSSSQPRCPSRLPPGHDPGHGLPRHRQRHLLTGRSTGSQRCSWACFGCLPGCWYGRSRALPPSPPTFSTVPAENGCTRGCSGTGTQHYLP